MDALAGSVAGAADGDASPLRRHEAQRAADAALTDVRAAADSVEAYASKVERVCVFVCASRFCFAVQGKD